MNTRRLVLLLALAASGCDRSRSEAPPPPSSLGACAGLDAEACRTLAGRHARFGGGPFNPLRSLWLYEDACRLGNMRACADAADVHAQRLEHRISPNTKDAFSVCKGEDGVECVMPTDNTRAAVLYVRACRAGVAAACTWGGDLYLTDYEGLPKDVRAALHMFELACAADDAHGCYLLGELVAGDEIGVKDPARAASLQDKSCALGDRDGCWRAGYDHDEGWGVARDPAIAVARYRTICDKYFDFLCCTRLADHYVSGDGVAKDPARAAALYRQHCGDGKTGGGASCRKLAALYERGEGVEKNLVKAGELYLEACKTFEPDACDDAKRLGAQR